MNEWQAAKQIQSTVRALEWTGGELVFPSASVKITAGTTLKEISHLRLPAFLLKPMGGQTDPEYGSEPGFVSQTFQGTIFVRNMGDAVGEVALIGGNRQGDSRGAGLLEVQGKVLQTLKLLNGLEGFSLQLLAKSMTGVEKSGDISYVHRSLLWAADITVGTPVYPVPSGLTASVSGGNVTLTWVLPTARFDLVGAVLRRASGSTAPTSVTEGTEVTLASQLDESVIDTPGSGTWSYALFFEYNDGDTSYSLSANQLGVEVA